MGTPPLPSNCHSAGPGHAWLDTMLRECWKCTYSQQNNRYSATLCVDFLTQILQDQHHLSANLYDPQYIKSVMNLSRYKIYNLSSFENLKLTTWKAGNILQYLYRAYYLLVIAFMIIDIPTSVVLLDQKAGTNKGTCLIFCWLQHTARKHNLTGWPS